LIANGWDSSRPLFFVTKSGYAAGFTGQIAERQTGGTV